MKEFVFPQYRKYPNNKNYFKIISATEFEELNLMGSKCFIHHKIAHILPDRNLIMDMLQNIDNHWVVIEKKEYEVVLDKCLNSK